MLPYTSDSSPLPLMELISPMSGAKAVPVYCSPLMFQSALWLTFVFIRSLSICMPVSKP